MKKSGDDVSLALVGINGYGNQYLNHILDNRESLGINLTGIIDPTAAQNERFDELQTAGYPIFNTLEEFYQERDAQVVTISTPIHMHLPMSETAALHHANVLCEKPLTATAAEAWQFRELEEQNHGVIAVGYQWSFSDAVQALKKDIMAGTLGAPKRLRTLCLWPRPLSYYRRNNWAGRKRTDNGVWVLDSPANNATAHFLHNMLYLLGEETAASTFPESVEAKLYRANDIENYDAAAIYVHTDCGAEVYFYTTHSVNQKKGPVSHFEFEKADVYFDINKDSVFQAYFHDGQVKDYGNPNINQLKKLDDVILAARSGAKDVPCGVRAAMAQTLCIDMVQTENEINNVPPDKIRKEERPHGDNITWVEGMAEAFETAYNNCCLPEGIL
ncbi:MAG: Gfo/Idh/MocA family protein [Lentisphaeria bacterium]